MCTVKTDTKGTILPCAKCVLFWPMRIIPRDGNREPVLVKNRFPVDRFLGIVSQNPFRFRYRYLKNKLKKLNIYFFLNSDSAIDALKKYSFLDFFYFFDSGIDVSAV